MFVAPTKALKKFASNKNCRLIVALDKKSKKFNLKNSIVLSTSYQHKKWNKLSNMIGWNCIQRRNFAILEAFERGAETIALIDCSLTRAVSLNEWSRLVELIRNT